MMKKTLLLLLAAVFCTTLRAQTGEVRTRPAGQGERLLTMEEATISAAVYPQRRGYSWNTDGSALTFAEDGILWSLNPDTGERDTLLTAESLGKATGTVLKDFPPYMWTEDGQIRFASGHDIIVFNPDTHMMTASTPMPEGAANLTPGKMGRYAYTVGNSLYFCDMNGNATPVAESSDPAVSYGQFVSRNEFGITGGIFWSVDGKKLAFYRKDESAVTLFPLLDINTRTGSLMEIRYPMAGMASENVRLGIMDIASGETVYVKADDFGHDQYLTCVTWAPDGKSIFIQVLDRSQKHMRLNMYDAESGELVRTVLEEENSRYVEPEDQIWFLKGSSEKFIYRTDNRDGYENLYLCDIYGGVKRLTVTDADVQYAGNDGKDVFYTSAEVSPVENHLFKVNVRSGKTTRLTEEEGWHTVSMSPDCRHFVDSYSSFSVPRVISLKSARKGETVCGLFEAEDPAEEYAWCEMELGTVKSADGKYDNWYRLIKPKDFDPDKKYPVILYVYGGPHSQLVKDTWCGELRAWEMYMAQRGYIVYVQDNRGTINRGAEYEKAIWGQCGQAEMADQMEGIKMLMSRPYVDGERIGVHGWSYGGFMTISLITNYPDVFKVAVAGGPVIDWKWYEVMYGERYMGNPTLNADGYEKTSLIARAGDLKGKLLICQGAVDNVVVWEHSLSFIRECIRQNVQVDYFPYPCAQHNVLGKDRIHLMNKVTAYFDDYL